MSFYAFSAACCLKQTCPHTASWDAFHLLHIQGVMGKELKNTHCISASHSQAA